MASSKSVSYQERTTPGRLDTGTTLGYPRGNVRMVPSSGTNSMVLSSTGVVSAAEGLGDAAVVTAGARPLSPLDPSQAAVASTMTRTAATPVHFMPHKLLRRM